MTSFIPTTDIFVLVSALADSNPSVRCSAVLALGNIGKSASSAIPILVGLLADTSKKVQQIATNSLLKIDPAWNTTDFAREGIPTLIRALANSNPEVQESANITLDKIFPDWAFLPETQAILPEWVNMLTQSDIVSCFPVVCALGKIGPALASKIPDLINLLPNQNSSSAWYESDQNQVLYQYVAWILGNIGVQAQSSVTNLVLLLVGDNDLCEIVEEALNKISPQWIHTREAQLAIPTLAGLLANTNELVATKAATILIKMAEEMQSAVTVLASTLLKTIYRVRNNSGHEERHISMYGFISKYAHIFDQVTPLWRDSSCSLTAIPALIRLLPHVQFVHLRRSISGLLSRISPIWQRQPIVELAIPDLANNVVAYDQEFPQSYSLRLLEKIGPMAQPAIPALIKFLAKTNNSHTQIYIEKALIAISHQWQNTPETLSVIPDLVSAIRLDIWQNIFSDTYEQTIKTLALIGAPAQSAISTLIIAGVSRNDAIYQMAVKALQAINPQWYKTSQASLTIPNLIIEFSKSNLSCQHRIAEIFSFMGPVAKSAIPDLVVMLASNNHTLRHSARTALNNIDPHWYTMSNVSRAVPALIQILADTNITRQNRRQLYAVITLGLLEKFAFSAVPNLIFLLTHNPNINTQIAVIIALGFIGVTEQYEVLTTLTEMLDNKNIYIRLASYVALWNFTIANAPANTNLHLSPSKVKKNSTIKYPSNAIFSSLISATYNFFNN